MGNFDVRVSNVVLGAAPIRGILLSGCEELEGGFLERETEVEADGTAIDGGFSEGVDKVCREAPAMAFVEAGLCEIMIVSSIVLSLEVACGCFGSWATFLGWVSVDIGGRCT